MTPWEEMDRSLDRSIAEVRQRAHVLADIEVGRVDRGYSSAMCTVELVCGKTRGQLIWVEERHASDQIGEQFDELVAVLRRREAKRVEEYKIRMSTMARFYEVEA